MHRKEKIIDGKRLHKKDSETCPAHYSAAVSLASQITFVFNLILTALTIGENMFVAQYYGKKDYDGLRSSAGFTGNIEKLWLCRQMHYDKYRHCLC